MDKDSSSQYKTELAGKEISQAGEHGSMWADTINNVLNLNPLKKTALVPVNDAESQEYNENVRNVKLDLSNTRNYVQEFLDWRVENHAGWKFWLYQCPMYREVS